MKPNIHGPALRLALALGLFACAWLILSASKPGDKTLLPAGAAITVVEPERIYLAQANVVPVERPVSYSSDQANRGEAKYESACLECHGDDLKGGLNGGAPLRGTNFEQNFANGAPASALYLYTSTLMPPNAPGRYSPKTYANLVAYILKRNGFRAGAPLPSDIDALDYLIVEK